MKSFNLLIILSLIGMFVSCQKSEIEKSNEAALIKVSGTFGTGVIDTISNTVIIKVPDSTDVTKMIANFEISKNATIYPPTGVTIDYSNPVNITVTSGDKTTKRVFTITVIKPIVNFTVYDCSNWTLQSYKTPEPNAKIKVYLKAEDVGTTKTYDVLTSDQNAQAVLYGLKTNNYYYTVEKDNKSDIINGYILIGTYNTQQDIDNSAIYAGATIGGLRYLDFNGDGRINSDDKSNYETIWSAYDLVGKTILSRSAFISTVK